MFLQNWESIQAIKMTCSVETVTPSVFGGSSRALKGHNGTVSAGAIGWVGGENIASSTYYSSALLCGLKPGGGWTNASGGAALAATLIAAGLGPVLAVGSGTAAAANEDYTLTDITSLTHVGYSYGAVSRSASGWWRGWVGRTLKNETAAAITVTETGIYLPLYCGSTSAAVSMAALVYRELLAEPVTIQPGAGFTFAVKLRFFGKR